MLTRAAQRSRLELSVCYYRAWTPLWAPYCMVLSARVYSHLVIDYDANMSGLCQLHGSRSHGFGFHCTRQRHFIFRYIRSNAQVRPSHLFVGGEHGLNCFFEFGICSARTGCNCKVQEGKTISRGEQMYCSDHCANARTPGGEGNCGCSHPDCGK